LQYNLAPHRNPKNKSIATVASTKAGSKVEISQKTKNTIAAVA